MIERRTSKATVELLSLAEATARRDEALARSGMSYVELKARGKQWLLDADQRALLEQIEELDWLIGSQQ